MHPYVFFFHSDIFVKLKVGYTVVICRVDIYDGDMQAVVLE